MVFGIGEGDTDPALRVILKDAGGKVYQVQSGDVVTFRMRSFVPGLRADVAAAAFVNAGAAGDVEYRWNALDTAVPGVYDGEFHVSLAGGGGEITFPNGEFIRIVIHEKAARP